MLTLETLKDDLKAFFRGEVWSDEAHLEQASRDTSLFSVKPQLVVAPRDANDLACLVAYAHQMQIGGKSVTLTARSAGTDMTGGPLSEGIIVEMLPHFNGIKEMNKEHAVVEPGLLYRDFERETKKLDRLMPSYTASKELCSVGGMVSNNSGGEKTLRYGKTEDYVNALRVVLADGSFTELRPLNDVELSEKKKLHTFEGEIYRRMHTLIEKHEELLVQAKPNVTKNSAGYYLWNVMNRERGTFDLSKLIVGSQGTLALVTEIDFRLITPAPHSRLVVIFLNEMRTLATVIQKVLSFHPETLESYDEHTLRFAVKMFPMIMKRMKGSGLRLGLRFFPEFKAALFGGIPKLVLLAEFTGATSEEVEAKAVMATQVLKKGGYNVRITKDEQEAEKYWIIRRESFNLLRQKMKHVRTAPFIEDFSVRPNDLPRFLPELYAILDKYDLTYTTAGHMGDANFHIIPLMDMSDPHSKEVIVELMKQVYTLILKYKGSITGEHNDGLIRSSYLRDMYGDAVYALFEETKKIFDPHNIFNPGKKVNADRAFALAHMVTTNG